MNLNESLRDWINHRIASDFPDLAGIARITMNEVEDIDPPCLRIYETGSSLYTQGDVTLDGVSNVEIAVVLETVPGSESGETTPALERTYREQLYDILGDRAAIDYISDLNYWRVFDIRLASPITEPTDGRMVSTWNLSLVACPL